MWFCILLLTSLGLVTGGLAQYNVPSYFYANAKAQRCDINGLSLYAPMIGNSGNLCAYIAQAKRVYACPSQNESVYASL